MTQTLLLYHVPIQSYELNMTQVFEYDSEKNA